MFVQSPEDYKNRFYTLNWDQRAAFWVKQIGTLQRLLPIHILQRYCDPDVNFFPLHQFNGQFRRSTTFYNWVDRRSEASIFSSKLSIDFGLSGGVGGEDGRRLRDPVGNSVGLEKDRDLPAIRRLDEVSTNEMNNVVQRLHDELLRAQHMGGFQP